MYNRTKTVIVKIESLTPYKVNDVLAKVKNYSDLLEIANYKVVQSKFKLSFTHTLSEEEYNDIENIIKETLLTTWLFNFKINRLYI